MWNCSCKESQSTDSFNFVKKNLFTKEEEFGQDGEVDEEDEDEDEDEDGM